MKIVATNPERQAFLANEVSTGIKLAIAPIDDPPITDIPRIENPIDCHHQGSYCIYFGLSISEVPISKTFISGLSSSSYIFA